MTTTVEKKDAFEYYVIKLHEWYKEILPDSLENDFSTLKILKLLFFGVASESNNTPSLLDSTFSNFYAMPYGHVEGTIYDLLKKKEHFSFIDLQDRKLNFIKDLDVSSFKEGEIKTKIDNSIKLLKAENPELIIMSASDLVKLSHEWYSWKYYFNKAKNNGTFSELIPIEIIKNEQKFYNL